MEKLKKILVTAFVVLSLVFMISGCVKMTVTQKIKRNGASDINLSTESDSEMILSALKNQYKKNLAVSNAILHEKENGFTYAFKNIKYKSRDLDKGAKDKEIFGNTSFEFNKEFKFPYYYMTIRFKNNASNFEDQGDYQSNFSEFGEQLSQSIEVNYDLIVFGEITDTNGQKMSEKKVRFDLTESKEYYVEFRDLFLNMWLSSLTSKDTCAPEWDCEEWSSKCVDFKKTRECTVTNDCDNYMYKPKEEISCQNFSVSSVEPKTTEYMGPALFIDFERPGFGTLKLVNSTGGTVGSTYVSKGDENATIYFGGTPKAGNYELMLKSEGKEVYSKKLSFEGPKLTIDKAKFNYSYNQFLEEYSIDYIGAEVKNEGDLPGKVALTYKIGGEESSLGYEASVAPSEKKIFNDTYPLIDKPAGNYNLSIYLKHGGEVIDQKSTTISLGEEESSDYRIDLELPSTSFFQGEQDISVPYDVYGVIHNSQYDIHIYERLFTPSGNQIWPDYDIGRTNGYVSQNREKLNYTLSFGIGENYPTGEYTLEVTVYDYVTGKTVKETAHFDVW